MRNIHHLRRVVSAAVLSLALVASGSVALGAEEPGDVAPSAQSGAEENSEPVDQEAIDLGDLDPAEPSVGSDDLAEAPAFDATVTDVIIQAVAEDPTLTVQDLAVVLGLPTEGPLSLIHDGEMLSVGVNFESDPSPEQVDAVGAVADVRRVLTVAPVVMAYVAPTSLHQLVDAPGVVDVEVNLSPETAVQDRELTQEEKDELLQQIAGIGGEEARASTASARAECRTIPAAANPALRVDEASAKWGVDGTGVTVGILSTTYDSSWGAYTSAAEDVSKGLLPGVGNPCGYTQPVRVLHEDVPSGMENDEARAMAQVIHGIAPGADLVVVGLGRNKTETAQNISELVDAGVDIIVDDISWSNELSFQKDIMSREIDRAKQKGILYFSSAGNDNSIQETGGFGSGVGYPVARHQSNRYVATSCPSWVLAPAGASSYDCMDFSPDGSGTPYGLFLGTPGYPGGVARPYGMSYVLNWSEPANGVTTNLQLQLYGIDTSGVTPSVCFGGASLASSPKEPYRYASWDESCPLISQEGNNYFALVVVRKTSTAGYGTPMVRATTFSGGNAAKASWREFHKTEGNNVLQGSLYGHHGDGSSFSVAAAPWDDPYVVESYSSLGGNEQWFGPAVGTAVAAPLPQKTTPDAPRIMGLDGIINSFFGSYLGIMDGQRVYGFYGTSASAPTVAAVAALGLQKAPGTSVSVMESRLQGAANGALSNPYAISGAPSERVFGTGLVDALAFLDSLPGDLPGFSTIPSPRLEGSPYVGDALSIMGAAATDFSPTADSVAYQWQRNGTAIAGATGASYTLVAADLNQTIRARVTGTKSGYRDGIATTTGVKIAPRPPNDPFVYRLSGPNRYETNLSVNQQTGVASKPVFIATGTSFADALSIGPVVSIVGASLFLVPPSSVNQATLNQIKALSPSAVYIVGGAGAVPAEVAQQIGAAVGKTPVRVSGSDRYATSEAIYKRFFVDAGRAVNTAFVATGRDYPDALSAAAAGGALRAPVILVDGTVGTNVSTYVKSSLKAKNVSEVLVAGGPGAVNATIQQNLAADFNVRRLSGATRYETNAAVNNYVGSKSSGVDLKQVWLATGKDFPDALSAAVPAGNSSRRLVLSDGYCIPKPVVTDWITKPESKVTDVVLVGGAGALSPEVLALTQCE